MPTPSFIAIPDAAGQSQQSGVFVDDTNIKYPAVRFDYTKVAAILAVTGAYTDGEIVGTAMTFSNVAAANGWGGVINSASLQLNNTAVINDIFNLLLFSVIPTVTNDTALTALSLSDAIADSYIGTLTFAQAHQTAARSLFRVSGINQRYTCESGSKDIYGFLTINNTASRSLSAARITTTLQIAKG